MTATPLPETPSSTKTIPFNLYFHGLDKPHWSAELDGINPNPNASRLAEKSRALVGSARRRRVAGLHDSIKRLERSVTQLNDLDETGLADVAAQHIERRLANTISQCRSLLEDINDATDSYRVYEHVATTPPPPEGPAEADEPVQTEQVALETADRADRLEEQARREAEANGGKLVFHRGRVTAIVYPAPINGSAVLDQIPSPPSPADLARKGQQFGQGHHHAKGI